MFYTKNLFLVLSLFFSSILMNGQDVIYVSQSATGTNTGDSWANAYNNLQSALAEASSGDQVWVAQGIYVPGTVPIETFSLIDGVEMYGGFQGTESLLNQRDLFANPTVLSGDLNQDDVYGPITWYSNFSVNTPNSYHVVSGLGLSRTTVLDGFIVEAGYIQVSLGWTFMRNSGGGLFLQNSSPTLNKCVFRRNLAWNGNGAAIYNSGGHPLITNCSFDENYTSLGRGAGIANEAGGDLTVISTSFTNNRIKGADISQALGGAIYSDLQAGTVRVTDCTFENNTLGTFYAIAQNPNYGGAIYSAGDGLEVYNSKFSDNESHLGGAIAVYSNLLMVNSVLANNMTYPLEGGVYAFGDRGGAIYFAGTSADGSTITNSTIIDNISGEGAGIFNAISTPFALHNSIVYGNVATGEDVWILKAQIGGGFDSFYSCVEGVLQTEPGEDPPNPENFPGCIDSDPMIDHTSPLSILMENSPCIDAGKNSYYSVSWPAEGLDGTNRFIDNPDVADTGQGLAPLIDMGASENGASGDCDPNSIMQPTGLNVSFTVNQFTLSWTGIPGTGPCQIQAGTSAANAQSITVQGDAPSSKTLPSSYLTTSQTYGWRVRCACSSAPTTAGPWSAVNYFSLPAAIGSIESTDLSDAAVFKVFPNPGNEFYKVQVDNEAATQIIVRNVLGQVIWQAKVTAETSMYDIQLDGSSGIYFFQLMDNQGQPLTTTKVMKL
jgi:hypothetical protein